jgi:hypothetical protein
MDKEYKMDKYRFDGAGGVFEYSNQAEAYVFCGRIGDDETEKEWIARRCRDEDQVWEQR